MTESIETLRALALGRAATGGGVDSSSDARLGESLRSTLRVRALGLAAGVRDLCRPRTTGGGGVPISNIAGTAVGIVGTGIGSGVGGGAGGGGGGPVLYVTLIGRGSFFFFPGFLTFTAPAPGGGGGG